MTVNDQMAAEKLPEEFDAVILGTGKLINRIELTL